MAKRHRYATLFANAGCPHCQRVLDFMADAGLKIRTISLDQWPRYANELVELGGKLQVPCLVADGKPLYEADDIIAFLREHADELR